MTRFPIIPPDPSPEEVEAMGSLLALAGNVADAVAGFDLDTRQRGHLNAAGRAVASGQRHVDTMRRTLRLRKRVDDQLDQWETLLADDTPLGAGAAHLFGGVDALERLATGGTALTADQRARCARVVEAMRARMRPRVL